MSKLIGGVYSDTEYIATHVLSTVAIPSPCRYIVRVTEYIATHFFATFYVKSYLYILLHWKTQAHYTALFQTIEDFGPFTHPHDITSHQSHVD